MRKIHPTDPGYGEVLLNVRYDAAKSREALNDRLADTRHPLDPFSRRAWENEVAEKEERAQRFLDVGGEVAAKHPNGRLRWSLGGGVGLECLAVDSLDDWANVPMPPA